MTISATITVSNIVGQVPVELDPLAEEDALTITDYLPSVFMRAFSSCEVQFNILDGTVEPPVAPTIVSISVPPTNAAGQTITVLSNNRIRIAGNADQIENDSFYRFTMKDNSIRILPPTTTEPFYGLNKYKTPSEKELELQFDCNFVVLSLGLPVEFTYTVKQYYIWNYIPDIEYVAQLSPVRT